MNKLYLIALFTFVAACRPVSDDENQQLVSTYFFIRHAEKDLTDPENKNPDLTPQGYERAQKWSKIFSEVSFDAVYATDFIRTVETAKPTAIAQNLEIQYYEPGSIDYGQFLNNTRGQTLLVVGHSNSTPKFVNEILGMEIYEEIDESVYGYLFIVKGFGNHYTAERLRID